MWVHLCACVGEYGLCVISMCKCGCMLCVCVWQDTVGCDALVVHVVSQRSIMWQTNMRDRTFNGTPMTCGYITPTTVTTTLILPQPQTIHDYCLHTQYMYYLLSKTQYSLTPLG